MKLPTGLADLCNCDPWPDAQTCVHTCAGKWASDLMGAGKLVPDQVRWEDCAARLMSVLQSQWKGIPARRAVNRGRGEGGLGDCGGWNGCAREEEWEKEGG